MATSHDARQLARPFRLEAFAHPHPRARFPATPPVDDVPTVPYAVARAGSARPLVVPESASARLRARIRDAIGVASAAPRLPRASASASAESDTGGASRKVPTVTEMYVELREMEQAEANELSCGGCVQQRGRVGVHGGVCERRGEHRLRRAGGARSGVGAPNDAAVARAAVRKAREDRMAAIAEAEADEIACVTSGGGVECTAAFNEAYDRAYETTMAKTERYHSLLKRWIRSSGGRK